MPRGLFALPIRGPRAGMSGHRQYQRDERAWTTCPARLDKLSGQADQCVQPSFPTRPAALVNKGTLSPRFEVCHGT